MLALIFRYELINNVSPLTDGQYVRVFWNDATEAIEVYEYDDINDESGTLMTSGPDLGSGNVRLGNGIGRGSPENKTSAYSFCDVADLNYFVTKSTFPYAYHRVTVGHNSCSLLVCDLHFVEHSTTDATDTTTEDGAILVLAESSHGTIKYSLDRDFDYVTEGQTSNIFSGLLAGTYTVYAKDEIGCFASIVVVVEVPDFYNPKYRLEYTETRRGIPTRCEIWERGYEGEPIEVKGGSDPFILKYNGGEDLNKFEPLAPSEARLTLLSPSHFYFLDLFTQDERKYQIRYFKDFGRMAVAFIPADIDPVEDWDQTSLPDVLPIYDYISWVDESVTLTLTERSQYKYTEYLMEAGRTYSFAYEFMVAAEMFGPKQLRSIRIFASNSIYSSLGAEIYVNITSNGSKTGTFEFVAPAGADRIAIEIIHGPTSGSTTYELIDFVNNTLPGPEEPVGYELKWIGYVIASNYKEAYKATPYPVTIVATDGLSDLEEEDFLDVSGNKFAEDIITLDAIVEILKKTDLNLNIITNVNRLEESMTASALAECKFDPQTFYHEGRIAKCDTVLAHLLKPFGCRIFQRHGKFFISTIEEAAHAYECREHTPDGEFIETITIDDFLEIENRVLNTEVAFINKDQNLEVIPAYGKFYFEHLLLQNASLIKSYSFETEDLYETAEGHAAFRNWTTNITQSPGAEFGIKETKAFEGDFNFYYKPLQGFDSELPPRRNIRLLSAEGLIEYGNTDLFECRFNYAVILRPDTKTYRVTRVTRPPLWVRMRWFLKVGSQYFNALLGTWSATEYYNEMYVEDYNEDQEFKIVAPMPITDETVTESLQMEFVLFDELDYAWQTVDDVDYLKTIPTVDLEEGYRIKGKYSYTTPHSGTNEKYLYWELSYEQAEDDGFNTVRPDDYDDEDNPKVWILIDEVINRRSASRGEVLSTTPSPQSKVSYWYMDNVVVRLLPGGYEPPENITLERVNNAHIKINFEDQFLLNDIDIDNINNSERTYKNYFKKLDGSPTQVWERTYRAGKGKLLELVSDDFLNQYRRQSFKLTGSIIANQEINYSTILKELFDNGKKYMFMGFELHDKDYKVQFDIAELKDVVSDDSGDTGAGFTTGFSLGFRA